MDLLESKEKGTCVFALRGKLDASTSPLLKTKLVTAIDRGETNILLDCAGLDYVSSAGLRVLFETAYKIQNLAGTLACCQVGANVKKIFEMVDISTEITMFSSLEEALK